MADQITKMILFGEDFGQEIEGLNMLNFGIALKDIGIEDEDVKKAEKMEKFTKKNNEKETIPNKKVLIKKSLGHHKVNVANSISKSPNSHLVSDNMTSNYEMPKRLCEPQEKDLNLKLICVSEGEKIYRLSDLFIPKDERVIKQIEKYNKEKMTLSEKDKQEKGLEGKKEMSDAEEIKHLIRKAKRNQKSTKITVTYNEKFFDRTPFLENIYTEKLSSENANAIYARDEFKQAPDLQFYQNDKFSEGDLKRVFIPKNKQLDDKVVESNLLNSLYFTQLKLKNNQDSNLKDVADKSETEVGERNMQLEYEKLEVLDLNNTIRENLANYERDENIEKREKVEDNSQEENEKIKLSTPNNNASFIFNDTFLAPSNNNNKASITDSNPDFKMFSLNNSLLFKNLNYDQKEKDNLVNEYYFQDRSNIIPDKERLMKDISNINNKQHSNLDFKFKTERDNIEVLDLFDNMKRKRYRSQGYYNEMMISGSFIDCIIFSEENVNKKFKEISKKIYDMNDYNMNFEVLKSENKENQARETNNSLISNGGVNLSGEDFFTNLINQKLIAGTSSQQQALKIGKTKGNLLTHAKCAYNLIYNKINLTYEDLKDFHRPNFGKYLNKEKKKRQFSFTISDKFNISHGDKRKRWDCTVITRNYLRKKEKKRYSKNIQYMNAYEIFKDRFKLSLVDGKYSLFEHIDEHPLFVSNFGMASRLKKFIYSSKLLNINISNPSTKLTETELKTYNMIGPYGIQIPLQPGQKLPLIGQIEPNELKGLSIIDNKMFRAPVFYEKMNSSSGDSTNANKSGGKKYYNFLIVFKKSKDGKEGFYIRELDHHYTVAQEEPKIEVYPPQSRQYLNFFKNKIKTYTYKLYDEIGYKAGINFKVFNNLFPNATEQILKKNFREMRIEIDKNICYFTKLPNEDTQMLITPENVCQFESCQFGIFKLREVGIKNLTNPDKISYATNKFINQTLDLKQQFLGKVIEEELLTTPWNITQNFLQAKQIKGMLSIKGIGDPSNGQGGYSFLKMPVKSYSDNKTLKEEIDQLKTMNKNIKTVTGTDADLRKLSKEDIKLKLIQLGEDEEYINKLSRWERVSLLRYKSSKAAELGYEGDITKYARGTRMNSKLQRDAYQKNINEVFKKQIQYITGENNMNYYTDDSSEEEDDKHEFLQTEIPLEEEEDKKKGLGFMRNEIYANTKKKKKLDGRRVGIMSDSINKKIDDGKIIKVYKKNHNNQFPQDESSTKIKFEMKNVDMEYLKRKKKSSQSFDNVFEYEIDKANTKVSRKRRDTPEKLFNEMIEDIIDSCIKSDLTKLFHQPVKKKEYQDYYDIIKNPIDLGTMKNKTKRNEYSSISQIIADLDLMVSNSATYNGENHDVTIQGQKIRTLAENKINEKIEELKEIENKLNSWQKEN